MTDTAQIYDDARRDLSAFLRDLPPGDLALAVPATPGWTIRDIASEVRMGPEQGLPEECAASCDNLLTVPKDRFEPSPVGILGPDKTMELDRALRFALEISY
jgi:mRNA interferase MazF